MKTIEINGQEYPLYIGFDFIRELDRKHTHEAMGVKFGWGVGKILIALSQFSALGVVDFILAATNTLVKQPSEKEIEEQFEKWSTEEVIELCENFITLLAENSLTKAQMTQIGIEMASEFTAESE